LKLEERVCFLLSYQAGIPQGPEKFLALSDVSGTQVPLIVNEVI